MVRFTDAVLRTRLGCAEGFAYEQVRIVAPALGTGTLKTVTRLPHRGRVCRRRVKFTRCRHGCPVVVRPVVTLI